MDFLQSKIWREIFNNFLYKNMKNIFLLLISTLFLVSDVYARGGGGGSSSGGGGVGGIGGLIIALIFLAYAAYIRKKKIKLAKQEILASEMKDSAWDLEGLKKRVSDVFVNFQRDWSAFNVESMKDYLSDSYYRRMVLEMSVLKNQNRKNEVNNPQILSIEILEAVDKEDNSQDYFVAEVKAKANDVLWDTKENKKLFEDNNGFTEYWKFIRNGEIWNLEVINQSTEASELKETSISDFAKRNGFFYDADFGWLMMPNKGVIFRKSNFKTSDINNHVVGYFQEKLVEFYTFVPYPNQNEENFNNYSNINTDNLWKVSYTGVGSSGFHWSDSANYVVAQTVLPIEYNDILVRKKRKWFNFSPRGMRRIQTESNEFENKFCLWADPQDQVSSFELLTPNFMAKVYDLPFELNIEVVGKFLYFYAKSRKDVDYDKMLEILSWAFEEMKR